MSAPFEWMTAPEADFAVIGDPVGHSLSPAMHQAWFDHAGWNRRYVAIRVWIEELPEAMGRLKSLGYIGLNATLPLKERLAEILPSVDGFARRVGAVNTVDLRTDWGANTDAPGFLATLDPLGIEPGSRVLLLGAGGSARAIAAALELSGFELRIWNRHRDRAEALVRDLSLRAEVLEEPDLAGASLIVNSTAGTNGAVLPIDWGRFEPSAIAYDLMYGRETPFLTAARARGCTAIDGRRMLVEQGALSMEMWTGGPVDRSVMLSAVEQAIGAQADG